MRPRHWGWAIRTSRLTVELDACVLYPAPLRDFLMELAGTGLFQAKWSALIHDEWIRNVLDNRKDLTAEKLHRTRDLMNAAAPDSMVEDFLDLIPTLSLPDADDRHVLAAAIASSSSGIVTFNLSDFPVRSLSRHHIEAIHPDEFIVRHLEANEASVVVAAQRCRARLKNPPRTAVEYLETLERQGLPRTVAELRRHLPSL